MSKLDITQADLKALATFREAYPTWWYTIGICERSRDFTAAPTEHSPEIKFVILGNRFDGGFADDNDGTLADAIKGVMEQIAADIAFYKSIPPAVLKAIERARKRARTDKDMSASDLAEDLVLSLDEREA